MSRMFVLPTEGAARKQWPVGTFLREYFPNAIAYLAHLSWVANEQHNAGEPMHWARHKSTDQEDTMMRHFLEGGELDTDGLAHTGKVAWRALAALELELEVRFKDDAAAAEAYLLVKHALEEKDNEEDDDGDSAGSDDVGSVEDAHMGHFSYRCHWGCPRDCQEHISCKPFNPLDYLPEIQS